MNNEEALKRAKELLVSKLENYKVEKIAEALNRIKDVELNHDMQIKDLEAQIERIKKIEVLPRYGNRFNTCMNEEQADSKCSGTVAGISGI